MRDIHPLRAYRKLHDLSSEELAEKLKLAGSTITSYENGTRKIDADRAIDIERRIGIDRCILRPDLFKRQAA